MRSSRVFVSIIFALAATLSSASALTWLVKPDGTGDFPSIQAAIDGATPWDTILMADGVYTGPGNKDINWNMGAKPGLILQSQSGIPDKCFIDCEDSGQGIFLGDSQGNGVATVRGITIRNASVSSDGGGIHVLGEESSNALIEYCVFADNFSNAPLGAAAGVYVYDGPITIRGCTFRQNTTPDGTGALHIKAHGAYEVLVEDCWFIDNSSPGGTGAMRLALYSCYSSAVVRDCGFINNSGSGTGALEISGTEMSGHHPQVTIDHCTFSENAGEDAGGISIYYDDPHVTLTNTIIAFSVAGAPVYCDDAAVLQEVGCCDLYENAGGDWQDFDWLYSWDSEPGNIEIDPEFCGPHIGDYSYPKSSECYRPAELPACGVIGAGPVVNQCRAPGSPGGQILEATPPVLPAVATVHVRVSAHGMTDVTFRLATASEVTLAILDSAGRVVRTMSPGSLGRGEQHIEWDGRDDLSRPLARGVYHYRLEAAAVAGSGSCILLR